MRKPKIGAKTAEDGARVTVGLTASFFMQKLVIVHLGIFPK